MNAQRMRIADRHWLNRNIGMRRRAEQPRVKASDAVTNGGRAFRKHRDAVTAPQTEGDPFGSLVGRVLAAAPDKQCPSAARYDAQQRPLANLAFRDETNRQHAAQ